MDSPASLNKMKVADLKRELKNRNLSITGNKTELVERLQEALSEKKTLKPAGGEALNKSLDEDINEDEILAGGLDDSKLSEQEEAAVLNGNVKSKTVKGSPKKAAPAVVGGKENGVTEDSEKETGDDKEVDALSARAKRFGVVSSEVSKKATRAERFGIPLADSNVKKGRMSEPVDVEQLKKRAERFGEVVAKTLTKVEVDEKKKERASRFGITTPAEKTEAVETAKAARATRFASKEAEPAKAVVEEEADEEEATPAVVETATPKAKKPRIVF